MDASPYYMRMRIPAWLFGSGASPVTKLCRACGGSSCNATGRFPERWLRRATSACWVQLGNYLMTARVRVYQ